MADGMDERVQQLTKHIYTIVSDLEIPICVTVINQTYAVTYSHAQNENFAVGEVVPLQSIRPIVADRFDECTTEVISISKDFDFVLLRRNEGVFPVPNRILRVPRIGEQYLQLGLGRGDLRPDQGYISQNADFDGHIFVTGTSTAFSGDSGGGVFGCDNDLIGIVIATWALDQQDICTQFSETLTLHHPSAVISPIAPIVRVWIEEHENRLKTDIPNGLNTDDDCGYAAGGNGIVDNTKKAPTYSHSAHSSSKTPPFLPAVARAGVRPPSLLFLPAVARAGARPPSFLTAEARAGARPPSFLTAEARATPFAWSGIGNNRAAATAPDTRILTPPSSASPSPTPPYAKMTISYGRHDGGNEYMASIDQCSEFTFYQFRKLFAIESRTNKRFFFKAGVQGQPPTVFHWVAVVDDLTTLPMFEGRIEAKYKLLSEMGD